MRWVGSWACVMGLHSLGVNRGGGSGVLVDHGPWNVDHGLCVDHGVCGVVGGFASCNCHQVGGTGRDREIF